MSQRIKDGGPALLPCPFCGGQGALVGADYDGPADCWDTRVVCEECEAQGPAELREHGDSRQGAIDNASAAWNRRARQMGAQTGGEARPSPPSVRTFLSFRLRSCS